MPNAPINYVVRKVYILAQVLEKIVTLSHQQNRNIPQKVELKYKIPRLLWCIQPGAISLQTSYPVELMVAEEWHIPRKMPIGPRSGCPSGISRRQILVKKDSILRGVFN